MPSNRRSWNARLTDDTHALIVALAEHYSKIGAPTSMTAVVEMAVKELARTQRVTATKRHYLRDD